MKESARSNAFPATALVERASGLGTSTETIGGSARAWRKENGRRMCFHPAAVSGSDFIARAGRACCSRLEDFDCYVEASDDTKTTSEW
jgi:hypothetical protein